ncbi:hypothetical protein AVP42_02748 [Agromyces sp. NDB4Y10]|nr:hypothetical protein AVP42_02748 [Agromyces sp. NDB4Y10]
MPGTRERRCDGTPRFGEVGLDLGEGGAGTREPALGPPGGPLRRGERGGVESGAEPLEQLDCRVVAFPDPCLPLAQGGEVLGGTALGGPTLGEPLLGVAEGAMDRVAQRGDAAAPGPSLGRRVLLGVVEALLQQERLPQPPACPGDRLGEVPRDLRAELRLGEAHLLVGVAHRLVGAHEPRLGARLQLMCGPPVDRLPPHADSPEAHDRAHQHECGRADPDERGDHPLESAHAASLGTSAPNGSGANREPAERPPGIRRGALAAASARP